MGQELPLACVLPSPGYSIPSWLSGVTNSYPLCPHHFHKVSAVSPYQPPSFFCNILVDFPGLSKACKKLGVLCVYLFHHDHCPPLAVISARSLANRAPEGTGKDKSAPPRDPQTKKELDASPLPGGRWHGPGNNLQGEESTENKAFFSLSKKREGHGVERYTTIEGWGC